MALLLLCVVLFASQTLASDLGSLDNVTVIWLNLAEEVGPLQTTVDDLLSRFEDFNALQCVPEDVREKAKANIEKLTNVRAKWPTSRFRDIFDTFPKPKGHGTTFRQGISDLRGALNNFDFYMSSTVENENCLSPCGNHTRIYNISVLPGNKFVAFLSKKPLLSMWHSNVSGQSEFTLSQESVTYVTLTGLNQPQELTGRVWTDENPTSKCVVKIFVTPGADSLSCKEECQNRHGYFFKRNPKCAGDLLHMVKCMDLDNHTRQEIERCSILYEWVYNKTVVINDSICLQRWKDNMNIELIKNNYSGFTYERLVKILQEPPPFSPETIDRIKKMTRTLCSDMDSSASTTYRLGLREGDIDIVYNYSAPLQYNITVRPQTSFEVTSPLSPKNDAFTKWTVEGDPHDSDVRVYTQANGMYDSPTFMFPVTSPVNITQEIWSMTDPYPRLAMRIEVRIGNENSLPCYERCKRFLEYPFYGKTLWNRACNVTDPIILFACIDKDVLKAFEKLHKTYTFISHKLKESASKMDRAWTFKNVSRNWVHVVEAQGRAYNSKLVDYIKLGTYFNTPLSKVTWENLNETALQIDIIVEALYTVCSMTAFVDAPSPPSVSPPPLVVPSSNETTVSMVRLRHNNQTLNFTIRHDVIHVPSGYYFTLRKTTSGNVTALTRWTTDKGTVYYGSMCDSNSEQLKNGIWHNMTIVEEAWIWRSGPFKYKNKSKLTGTTGLKPVVVRVVTVVPTTSTSKKRNHTGNSVLRWFGL